MLGTTHSESHSCDQLSLLKYQCINGFYVNTSRVEKKLERIPLNIHQIAIHLTSMLHLGPPYPASPISGLA